MRWDNTPYVSHCHFTRVQSTRDDVRRRCCVFAVRASDKRIQGDAEYSDSEDEGEGGRRHRESFKQRKKLKTTPGASASADGGSAGSGEKAESTSSAAAPPSTADKPSESVLVGGRLTSWAWFVVLSP